MKKLALMLVLAIIGFSQQLRAADIVNNTNCDITVRIVFYNPATCGIISTCTTLSVPGHSSVTIPPCISSSRSLEGFEICWSLAVCRNCVSIGNSTGAHPCADFPLGPVTLTTTCTDCITTTPFVTIQWSTIGDLVIG